MQQAVMSIGGHLALHGRVLLALAALVFPTGLSAQVEPIIDMHLRAYAADAQGPPPTAIEATGADPDSKVVLQSKTERTTEVEKRPGTSERPLLGHSCANHSA
jgi:hypothetical protein